MITEYKIVEERSIASLEQEVNRLIGEGWQPATTTIPSTNKKFRQAMVKQDQQSQDPVLDAINRMARKMPRT